MSNLREAAQKVLEAWQVAHYGHPSHHKAMLMAMTALRAVFEQQEPYDQASLDLCDKCGWKTVVPGDGCLNCKRTEPVQELQWCECGDGYPPSEFDANGDCPNCQRTEPVQGLPDGWVPLRIEWEPGYPEDVAFGPQRMMDRLKKWLDKHFANLQRTEPEQEPVAWAISYDGKTPYSLWSEGDGPFLDLEVKRQGGSARKMGLYTHPPQRKPLTDEEIVSIELRLRKYVDGDRYDLSLNDFARAVEAAHGIKQEEMKC